MTHRLLLIALALAFTINPASAQKAEMAAMDPVQMGIGWSYVNLDMDIRVLPEAEKIEVSGSARLRLDMAASAGPTLVINGKELLMNVLSLNSVPQADQTMLNQPLLEEYPNARGAHLRFAKNFSRGDEITITFTYESIAQASQFKVNSTMALASWTEAWHLAPLFDIRSVSLSKGLSSTGVSRYHLPSGWSAASEGVMINRTESTNGVVETWKIDTRLARSFAAGPFTKGTHAFDGREVNVFLHETKPTSAEDQAVILTKAMLAMEGRFGPYPYPSYSIIEVPESMGVTWYAASQQGLIFARSEGFEYEGGNLPLFAHEMAHGWWGNLVGTDGPGSILCSESLAQYGAIVAIEELEGAGARNQFLRFSREGYSKLQCANGFFHIWRKGHDKPMVELTSGGWDHNLSDSKGHWIYHMLRNQVGDEIFFETLRGLIRDFAGKRMRLDDVRAAFISAAPNLKLDTFFTQWLERTGAPILDTDWWAVENGESVHLEITQSQGGVPYQLNLEVEIEFMDGSTRVEIIQLHEQSQSFDFKTDRRPVNLRLDPNDKQLIWRPEYGPRPAAASGE